MRTLIVLSLILFTISCAEKKNVQEKVENERPDVYANVIPELKANLEAHGGLEKWRSLGTLEYDRLTSSGGDHQVIDLKSRKDLVKNDSLYTIGFDGENVWITPDKDAKKNARFFHNLYFYFFAFPYVVADPGTNQEYLGQIEFNGKTYDKIKITYGENVGDSPEDQYILWCDAESKKLDFINYSVTYFDDSNPEKYNALVYDEWQEIDGLLMPKNWTHYRWENDTIGEIRGSQVFENVSVATSTPDPSLFEMPEGAMIDEMPTEE
ncbi:MAG: DUF6503 family protein [Cyclobacteriaceae bacterium]